MNVRFRYGTIGDIPVIREIAHTVWPVAYGEILPSGQLTYMLDMFYSDSSLMSQMTTKKHRFIIAEDTSLKTTIGFISYAGESGHRGCFHLHKLYLLFSYHGQGIGKLMIEKVTDDIRPDNGSISLLLNVNRNNPAIGFYRKNGFEIIREEDNDIGSGYFMNDYVMEKVILCRNPV